MGEQEKEIRGLVEAQLTGISVSTKAGKPGMHLSLREGFRADVDVTLTITATGACTFGVTPMSREDWRLQHAIMARLLREAANLLERGE